MAEKDIFQIKAEVEEQSNALGLFDQRIFELGASIEALEKLEEEQGIRSMPELSKLQVEMQKVGAHRNSILSKNQKKTEQVRRDLANGNWKKLNRQDKPTSKREVLRTAIEVAYGIPSKKIDLETGANWDMRQLAHLAPTEEIKKQWYEKLPFEEIIPIEIDGDVNYLLKEGSEKLGNEKYTLADEYGISAADLREVLSTVHKESLGIVSGIAGGAITGTVTGGAGIILGGEAARAATMTAIDRDVSNLMFSDTPVSLNPITETTRMFGSESPEALSDTYGRRSLEAFTGMGFDYGLKYIGGAAVGSVLKRVGKNKPEARRIKEMNDSLDKLVSRGIINESDRKYLGGIVRANDRKMMLIARKAESKPTSKLSEVYVGVQRGLRDLAEGHVDSGPAAGRMLYSEAVKTSQKIQDDLLRKVSRYDSKLARMLYNEQRKKAEEFGAEVSGSISQLDNRFSKMLQSQLDKAIQAKNEAYTKFYSDADSKGIALGRLDLATLMRTQYNENPGLRNSAVEKIIRHLETDPSQAIKTLEGQIAKETDPQKLANLNAQLQSQKILTQPMSLKTVRDFYHAISEAAPAGYAVKPPGAAAQAMNVSEEVKNLFEDLVSQAGMKGQWDEATRLYETRRASSNGVIGQILQTNDAGFPMLTNKQITQKVLSDPEYVQQSFDAINRESPEAAKTFIDWTRKAYLDANVQRSATGGVSKVKIDPNMVTQLWGFNSKGQQNSEFGKLMVKKIEHLNKTLEKVGGDASQLTLKDLDELAGAISKDRYSEVAQILAEKSKAQAKEKVLRSGMVLDFVASAAKIGDKQGIEMGVLPEHIFTAKDPIRTRRTWGFLDPQEKKLLRTDVAAFFFKKYAKKDSKVGSPYLPWDYDGIIRDLTTDKNLRKSLETVLGKEEVQTFIDVSRVAKKFDVDPSDEALIALRMVQAGGKPSIYVAGKATDAVKSAMMAPAFHFEVLIEPLRKVAASTDRATYRKRLDALNYIVNGAFQVPGAVEEVFRNDPEMMQVFGETYIQDKSDEE